MRYVLTLLALAGAIVAALALHVHYDTGTEPCSINEKWDCGVVNHSPFAVIGPVPVAAIGIAGYVVLAILAFARRKRLHLAATLAALAFSLYLTHLERDVLQVWCIYCVASLAIVVLTTILTAIWQFTSKQASEPKPLTR